MSNQTMDKLMADWVRRITHLKKMEEVAYFLSEHGLHDVRNPLCVISGFCDMLMGLIGSGEMDLDGISSYLKIMRNSSGKMDMITYNLRLLYDIASLEVDTQDLGMGEIVQGVPDRLNTTYRGHRIEIPDIKWPIVLGHQPWVEDVWRNYVIAAIQHLSQEPISLGARTSGEFGDFWVRYKGDQITESGDVFGYSHFDGTIGLYAANGAIQRLGGNTYAQNTESGAELHFTLPLRV